MIEASVSAALAAIAAGVALFNRAHSRINHIDRRIDMIEHRIAEQYVKREELTTALSEFKDHMIRIENKLDQIAQRNYK